MTVAPNKIYPHPVIIQPSWKEVNRNLNSGLPLECPEVVKGSYFLRSARPAACLRKFAICLIDPDQRL